MNLNAIPDFYVLLHGRSKLEGMSPVVRRRRDKIDDALGILVPNLTKAMEDYLYLIACGEARHATWACGPPGNPTWYIEEFADSVRFNYRHDVPSRGRVVGMIRDYGPCEENWDALEKVFGDNIWTNHGFGGSAWLDLVIQTRDAPNLKDDIVRCDTLVNVAHCSGRALNKGEALLEIFRDHFRMPVMAHVDMSCLVGAGLIAWLNQRAACEELEWSSLCSLAGRYGHVPSRKACSLGFPDNDYDELKADAMNWYNLHLGGYTVPPEQFGSSWEYETIFHDDGPLHFSLEVYHPVEMCGDCLIPSDECDCYSDGSEECSECGEYGDNCTCVYCDAIACDNLVEDGVEPDDNGNKYCPNCQENISKIAVPSLKTTDLGKPYPPYKAPWKWDTNAASSTLWTTSGTTGTSKT